MRFQYSEDYFPPAPVAAITLVTAAESLRTGPHPALLDSGADGTIVPIAWLHEIRAVPTVAVTMRSHWGERRSVLLYLVDVQVGELTLPGVEVVGDELSAEIVVGRDILNRLRVLLDGPSATTTLSD